MCPSTQHPIDLILDLERISQQWVRSRVDQSLFRDLVLARLKWQSGQPIKDGNYSKGIDTLLRDWELLVSEQELR